MDRFKDKVVIVAGGATGMGAATAERLSEEGASVLIGDINIAGAEATAARIVASGGVAAAFEFDIADESGCKALVATAKERWGAVHGLYNVAADLSKETLGRDTDVLTVPEEVLARTLAVNLKGYFYTSRYAIPAMLEAGGGSIVHTSSSIASAGVPWFCAYGASKAGVLALSRHIAAGWGKQSIRSNAIDPGLVITANQMEMVSQEVRDQHIETLWAPDHGQPEDIAATVAFLLSDEAKNINGQTLPATSARGVVLS